jgi:hypothetical protein
MTTSREIALDLLRRLLSGERDEVPLHLSLLLERSLLLAGSDETQYRQILPSGLADLKLSAETRDEIISTLCARVLQEPDAAFLAAMSFAGTDLVTKTMSTLLVSPPRPLTLPEKAHVVSIVAKYLPCNLAAHPQLLAKDELTSLIWALKELEHSEEVSGESWEAEIKHHSGNLLRSLAHLGIT